MNTADTEFVEELLRQVPDLQCLYSDHLQDNGQLLPHVFLGDVTKFAVAEADNQRLEAPVNRLLEQMESGLRTGTDSVKELISVSFVENLIGESRALNTLKPCMGPLLKAEVERLCE